MAENVPEDGEQRTAGDVDNTDNTTENLLNAPIQVPEDKEEDNEEFASSNNSSSTSVDENDADPFDGYSAKALFDLAKNVFCEEKDYEKAAEMFSRSVEKCKAELKTDDDAHPLLAAHHLWYADSLLTKEENKNDIFTFLKGTKIEVESMANIMATVQENAASTATAAKDEVSDEQIAFEMLELAKAAYAKRAEMADYSAKDAMDYSHVHIRLGDIQLMNEQFDDAVIDYEIAVQILKNFKDISAEFLISPTFSFAQALLFSGNKTDSLTQFEEALRLIRLVIDGKLNVPPNNSLKNLLESAEDVSIQIDDLKKDIKKRKEEGTDNLITKGSQTDAKYCIPTTTSYFDPPILENADESPRKILVITPERRRKVETDKAVTSGTKQSSDDATAEGDEAQPKRRRIDLSALDNS